MLRGRLFNLRLIYGWFVYEFYVDRYQHRWLSIVIPVFFSAFFVYSIGLILPEHIFRSVHTMFTVCWLAWVLAMLLFYMPRMSFMSYHRKIFEFSLGRYTRLAFTGQLIYAVVVASVFWAIILVEGVLWLGLKPGEIYNAVIMSFIYCWSMAVTLAFLVRVFGHSDQGAFLMFALGLPLLFPQLLSAMSLETGYMEPIAYVVTVTSGAFLLLPYVSR